MQKPYNCHSDFDFIPCEPPKSPGDEPRKIQFPDHDFEAVLYTCSPARAYTASCIGGVCTNCFNDNGHLHIVVNNHRLGEGTLKMLLRVEIPSGIYPDGFRRVCQTYRLGIDLIPGAADPPSPLEVEMLLPYIKGEPFTYDDFTEEQLAGLKKPATDAAASVSALESAMEAAEADRQKEFATYLPIINAKIGRLSLPIVNKSEAVAEIQPNVLNTWGEMAALTVTLAPPMEGYADEYCIQFDSGAVPTTLMLPETVKFPNDFEIEANMRYQISIINNIALIVGVQL